MDVCLRLLESIYCLLATTTSLLFQLRRVDDDNNNQSEKAPVIKGVSQTGILTSCLVLLTGDLDFIVTAGELATEKSLL